MPESHNCAFLDHKTDKCYADEHCQFMIVRAGSQELQILCGKDKIMAAMGVK